MIDDDDFDPPITEKAQKYLDKQERRQEQGLEYFPFFDAPDRFFRVGPEQNYTADDAAEVLRIVSSWYVKKNNAYHDVDNLQVKLQPHDIKQIIIQRMIEYFPNWRLSDQGWRDFFKLLLDPPVNQLNPEKSIPVWSGQRFFVPGNKQKIIFKNGMAMVNTWHEPDYRSAAPIVSDAFDKFLDFVIPNTKERTVFLDWLAWVLQHENHKPSWAILLYSEKQGTGKSTLADVLKELFGSMNTGRINGVSKLVGRFNKEVLANKLVIVEEVEVKRGSPQANRIKSLITEDNTMVEAKNMPVYVEDIFCAFVMTTNHLPLWLEESDRRFFILNFDHPGYANGGSQYKLFTKLVGELKSKLKEPKFIRSLYDSLINREVPRDFGRKLDISQNSTEIMQRLSDLSPDVVKQVVEEQLNLRNVFFVPVSHAHKLINRISLREANAQTHIFTELGWKKQKFAWDGLPQRYAWYKVVDPNKPPERGKVYTRKNTGRNCQIGWVTMKSQEDIVLDMVRPPVKANDADDVDDDGGDSEGGLWTIL